MNTATPFPWPGISAAETARSEFRSIFEYAPLPTALCDLKGMIIERNPAFERALDSRLTDSPELRLHDVIGAQDGDAIESALRDLLDARRDSIRIPEKKAADLITNWTVWRFPGTGEEATCALLMADYRDEAAPAPVEQNQLQADRWEAVGRLAGGVVHDFNNLLTGVTLYCDLLLSSLDTRDRRRRYADEIRSAILQAAGMSRQLLVFARPQATQVRALCLNHVAQSMQELLSRLIGEDNNIELRLDPDLASVLMDQAQAQQVLLNLVLNARDALPQGGRIVVETSNCRFQTVAGSTLARQGEAAFPCALLVVSDNGCGMDAKTRRHIFEPFFTTKDSGKGTGLGLTTVRSIVTANRGLIHLESNPGRGTRVMILLPIAAPSSASDLLDTAHPHSEPSPQSSELRKECLS